MYQIKLTPIQAKNTHNSYIQLPITTAMLPRSLFLPKICNNSKLRFFYYLTTNEPQIH